MTPIEIAINENRECIRKSLKLLKQILKINCKENLVLLKELMLYDETIESNLSNLKRDYT